eukprot:TRINITY_DN1068_c2_g1_i10.p1 TRINITY_DN1068_c2_g1~~TRINITY_DN1068_c2_g1_i10.p1  ORF type:complete len:163 (+),score=37.10 TRINITY_DN1068_c2_g1_i10:965-1453(+)
MRKEGQQSTNTTSTSDSILPHIVMNKNLTTENGHHILLCFVGYTITKSCNLSQRTDEQIANTISKQLKTLYKDVNSKLLSYYVTRWEDDEFSLGTYSYVKKGFDQSIFKEMSLPVDDKLFFAGEATHPIWPSTVHGAFHSGKREAENLVKIIQRNDKSSNFM